MSQPVNPYIAGAPLRGERGFFGRQDTLERVARELCNPYTNALVLFGQRRIGKTTLLMQLQRTLPTDAFLPVYFDLQDQATSPLNTVLADLADTVAEQAGLEPLNPDAFDDRGDFFRHTFLPRLYTVLGKNRRPVFLLDEFDVLDQVAEAELPEATAAKAFFPFLRQTMTEDPRPAFVFVIGRRAEDLSLDFTATFKASLVREIWVLDQESAEALVRQADANSTLRFTDEAVERILSLTNCHPYLTQLLCQRLWERAYTLRGMASRPTEPPLMDVPEVEAAVPDALEAGGQALVWLWNGLGPAEKIYTSALAELASEGVTISEDQVIQVLSAHAARLRTREVELAPRDLVKRRVLEEANRREYRFAVEFFRRWVRQHKALQEVKDELDRVEPMADSLHKMGRRYFNRRQWKTAIRHFRDALEVNPHHFHARLSLGEALLELGQTDEAAAELERAYKLDREEGRLPLTRALMAQAKAREEAGDENGTLTIYEQVLEISPNEQEALEASAKAYEKEGEWDNAVRFLEQLCILAPRNVPWSKRRERAKTEINLAKLYAEGKAALDIGQWAKAEKTFVEVMHIQPDYRDAIKLLTQSHQSKVKKEKLPKVKIALGEPKITQIPLKPRRVKWCLWVLFILAASYLSWIITKGLADAGQMASLYLVTWSLLAILLLAPIAAGIACSDPHWPGSLDEFILADSNGKERLALLGNDGVVRVWDLNEGRELFLDKGHKKLESLALQTDGRCLVLGDRYILNLDQKQKTRMLTTLPTGWKRGIIAINQGKQMAAAEQATSTVYFVDVDTGKILRKIEEEGCSIHCLAFSNSGKLLASGNTYSYRDEGVNVYVWDVSHRELIHRFAGHQKTVLSLAFEPKERMLASGDEEGKVQVWNLTSGKLLFVAILSGQISTLAFNPDGKILAVGTSEKKYGSKSKEIIIIDVHSGKALVNLEVSDEVLRVMFTTDGRQLLSACKNGKVYLWDVETAESLTA